MSYKSLSAYIAEYINEEISRGHTITAQTIVDAFNAYQGGAGAF